MLCLYTGWRLPIAQLDWWVRGLPAPRARRDARAGRGRAPAAACCQQGWQLRYESYLRVDGYDLPGRLTLARAGRRQPPRRWRCALVIDRWAQVR
ncbi:MAG: hypothetical protein MZV65_52485 [Chromatiales bacterium]|nr:hypothetical protein [Chromatiales bacterium]